MRQPAEMTLTPVPSRYEGLLMCSVDNAHLYFQSIAHCIYTYGQNCLICCDSRCSR